MSRFRIGTVISGGRDYERIYRRLHPKIAPYNPHERQRELHDLWEADQEEFRRTVDIILGDDPALADTSNRYFRAPK